MYVTYVNTYICLQKHSPCQTLFDFLANLQLHVYRVSKDKSTLIYKHILAHIYIHMYICKIIAKYMYTISYTTCISHELLFFQLLHISSVISQTHFLVANRPTFALLILYTLRRVFH